MDQVKHGTNKFYIGEDENYPLAMMTYVPSGDKRIIVNHTEVSEGLRGQNVGYELFESVIQFARENNLLIVPLCPFAKSIFDKTDKYNDVLA